MEGFLESDAYPPRIFKRRSTFSILELSNPISLYIHQLAKDIISKAIQDAEKYKNPEDSKTLNEGAQKRKRGRHLRSNSFGSSSLLKDHSIQSLYDKVIAHAKIDETQTNEEIVYDIVEPSKAELVEDKEGKKLAGYSIQDFIGEGEQGKVKLLQKGRQWFASKIFSDGVLKQSHLVETTDGDAVYTEPYEDFYREVAVMKKLNHANLIKLKEVLFDKKKKKYYMIMDYCSKGSIMDYDEESDSYIYPWKEDKDPFTDSQLEKIINNSVQGLYYLHYHGIAHRDIKPQNLLLCEDFSVKLADFGQSHLLSDARTSSRRLGTDFFISPELLTCEAPIDLKAADVWSLGITFYLIIFCEIPFALDEDNEDIENRAYQLEFADSREISEDLKDLLRKMLEKNPAQRIKAEQMIKHPFVERMGKVQEIEEAPICPTPSEIETAVKPMKQIMYSKEYVELIANTLKKDYGLRLKNKVY